MARRLLDSESGSLIAVSPCRCPGTEADLTCPFENNLSLASVRNVHAALTVPSASQVDITALRLEALLCELKAL